MNEIRGYKVFRPDWSCAPDVMNIKRYTCPGKFEEDVDPETCVRGMHFCENAADCFRYYPFDPENKVAEVIAYGKVVTDGVKSATDKLEIVREIPWDEVLRIVNIGKNCTGLCNTGDCNTGDCNTGDCNTGNRNTGDWNTSSFNTGCFMTEEPKIMLFNKPSDWTYRDWLKSDARSLLNQIPKNVVEWISSSDMSDEEKAAHPEHETTGGYLKILNESECGQMWWNGLRENFRDIIRSLPNFDPEIFKKCTGIDVNG